MRAVLLPLLLVTVIASAMSAAWSRHESRKLFNTLQQLEGERDAMNIEWGQLQLEQSTHTTHGKIESAARERLGMHIPGAQQVVILKP
jgi:cell division protein FtsL